MSKHNKHEKKNDNQNGKSSKPEDKPKGHSVPSRMADVTELEVGMILPLGNGDTTATIVNLKAITENIVIPVGGTIVSYQLNNGQAKGAYSYMVLGDYSTLRVALTPEEKRVEQVKSWVAKLKFWK